MIETEQMAYFNIMLLLFTRYSFLLLEFGERVSLFGTVLYTHGVYLSILKAKICEDKQMYVNL